jgi:hypothetical protein
MRHGGDVLFRWLRGGTASLFAEAKTAGSFRMRIVRDQP